ncbi:MAG: hypothetical protein RL007_905 [Bacteroidota bacterium]|jgi:protein TonB
MRARIILSILFLAVTACCLSAQELKKKRGNVKLRDTDGRIYAKGKARKYKRHGVWKTFSTDGQVLEMQTWNNGVKEGPYILYYTSGGVQDSGAYHNDLKQGKWVTRSSNGSLAFLREYDADKLNGKCCAYYYDGKPREVSYFKNDVALASRKWKSDGRLDVVEYYCEGKACGKWTEYPEDCIQKDGDTSHIITREYNEGKLNGFVTETRNGVVISKGEYADGMLNGKLQRWNPQGVIQFECNYINDQPNGSQKEFKSGALIRSVIYSRGIKQGRSSEYDLAGRVIEDRWYNGGLLDSAAVYHPNGKRSGFAKYSLFEGLQEIEVSGHHFEYDAEGKMILTGYSVEHKKSGVWTSYYPNGKVNSTTTYENGIPQGVYTRYYTNGKKMVQYNILPTGLNTPPDVWDEKGKVLSFGNARYQELYESSRPIESFNNGKPEELGLTREDQMKESSRKRSEEDNAVYEVVDVMPQFPGGDEARMSFIAKTIVYPQLAKENGEQGTIYVRYVVEKDGRVLDVSPLDGKFSSLVLAMEAVRVVKLFPIHTPGMLNGVPVRTQMVIPVKFVLQ